MENELESIDPHLWSIVLAGGVGGQLTDRLYSTRLPKQFATLVGEQSLLQCTVERMKRLVAPERIVVVVHSSCEAIAREQLDTTPELRILTQPADRGTAVGLALPVAWIRRRDATAKLLVTPSDHFIAEPAPFDEGMRQAVGAVPTHPLVLLGVPATRAETECGWIVPGAKKTTHEVREVASFVEKPCARIADKLLREGGLWSTLVFAAQADALWAVLRRHLPRHSNALGSAVARADGADLERVYEEIHTADLGRDVFQRARNLAVHEVPSAGWSDWATRARTARAPSVAQASSGGGAFVESA